MNNEPISNQPNQSTKPTQSMEPIQPDQPVEPMASMESAQISTSYLTPSPKIKNPTEPESATESIAPPPKNNFTPILLAAVLLFVSTVATVISVVKIVEASRIQELRKREAAALELKNSIVKRLAESTGRPINNPADVPDYIPLKSKLYINSWKVSLEIPQSIINLSYVFNFNENLICFNAAKKGSTFMPDFTNPAKNPKGIGCMLRLSLDRGLKDVNTGAAHGELVATFDDFNYFYVAPKEKFSKTKVEQDLEESATIEIKKMILAGPKKY